MVAIDPAPFDLSLATVTCELPPCLERTEPPWLTYTECTSQTERIFPWTAGSGWTTEPRTAAVPKTREAGKEKARIIAGHRTFLPNGEGFGEYISGGMGTEEAAKYIEKHWKGIQSDLISEKYGSGSYAQAYVAGEVSEEDFLFLQNNWKLDSRLCDFIPPNETPQQATVRQANKQVLENGVSSIRQLYMDTYDEGYGLALEALNAKPSGVKHRMWLRRRDHWNTKKQAANLPALPNTALMNSREEVEAARIRLPFGGRDIEEKLMFWSDKFGKDNLASHLIHSRHVLDIRKMCDRRPPPGRDGVPFPPYPKMYKMHWAYTCNILHKYVTSHREAMWRIRTFNPDMEMRASSIWPDRSKDAYDDIRHLYNDLRFDQEDGHWQQIPILRKHQEAPKRKAPARDRVAT